LVGWKVVAPLLAAAGISMAAVIDRATPLRSQHHVVRPVRGPPSRALATASGTNAQAERMRSVTVQLAGEMRGAVRCHPTGRDYEHCVLPALRHTVIAGRFAAFVLRTVLAPVPDGRCRSRLIDLQVANGQASAQAQWTLSGLYDRSRRARRHEAAVQTVLIAAMLTRAASSTAGACSLADGPPS
jgi:hypothetical protein